MNQMSVGNDSLCMEVTQQVDLNPTEVAVVSAQMGERAAFVDPVKHWAGPIDRYLTSMVSDKDAVDDISQEVWIKIMRGLPKLQGPSRFAPWVFTIARRSIADQLRLAYRALDQTVFLEADAAVEDHAESAIDRVVVQDALGRLTVGDREAVVLHYLEGLSVGQTARVLEIPEGTVKSRLFRARQMMNTNLKGTDSE